MATYRWSPGSEAVAQVQNYTFAGTWEADDLIRITPGASGAKVVDVVAGSTTPATIVDTVVAAWNALSATDYPEFAEVTASRSGDDLILTADTAGKPFIFELTPLETGGGAADAQTIEGVGTSTIGTTTTASAGPLHLDDGANWVNVATGARGTAPGNTDTAWFENLDLDVRYGIDQLSNTLAAVTVRNCRGSIGLPDVDEDGDYPQYRETYVTVAVTAFLVDGENAPSRIRWDFESVQTTARIDASGRGADDGVPAVLLVGTHASNVVNVTKGEVGLAWLAGETATWVTMNLLGDGQLFVGAGVTTTTLNQYGGECELRASLTTVNKRGGRLVVQDAAAITTLNNDDGDVIYRSTGTIGTYNGGDDARIDFSQDPRARTVTDHNVYGDHVWDDRNGTVTMTNEGSIPRGRLKTDETSGVTYIVRENSKIKVTYI